MKFFFCKTFFFLAKFFYLAKLFFLAKHWLAKLHLNRFDMFFKQPDTYTHTNKHNALAQIYYRYDTIVPSSLTYCLSSHRVTMNDICRLIDGVKYDVSSNLVRLYIYMWRVVDSLILSNSGLVTLVYNILSYYTAMYSILIKKYRCLGWS